MKIEIIYISTNRDYYKWITYIVIYKRTQSCKLVEYDWNSYMKTAGLNAEKTISIIPKYVLQHCFRNMSKKGKKAVEGF